MKDISCSCRGRCPTKEKRPVCSLALLILPCRLALFTMTLLELMSGKNVFFHSVTADMLVCGNAYKHQILYLKKMYSLNFSRWSSDSYFENIFWEGIALENNALAFWSSLCISTSINNIIIIFHQTSESEILLHSPECSWMVSPLGRMGGALPENISFIVHGSGPRVRSAGLVPLVRWPFTSVSTHRGSTGDPQCTSQCPPRAPRPSCRELSLFCESPRP